MKINDDVKKSCHGDHVSLDFNIQLRLLLKGLGLTTVAQGKSIELCLTSDGATLTNNISHTSAGMKVTDLSSVNPETGDLLFVDTATCDEGYLLYKNAQSTKNIALSQIILAPETNVVTKDVFPLLPVW